MRNKLLIIAFIIVYLLCFAEYTPAQEYKPLSEVENEINQKAQGSGGDATASKLTDSSGNIIQTIGVDAPDNTKDIKRRNIWLLKIAKGGNQNRVKLLVTGTHHAREWVAYRVVLDGGKFILLNKANEGWDANDSRFDHFRLFKEMNIKKLTDNANVFLIPVVNPEGYQYSKSELARTMWRKNRRDVIVDPEAAGEPKNIDPDTGELLPYIDPETGEVYPYIGVDLNRNYPSSDWGTVTYWPGTTDETTSRWRWEEVYCGLPRINWTTPPFSPPRIEKETDGVKTLSANNIFACHIDVHSFGGTVGWVQDPANNNNLRPDSGLNDIQVFKIMGAKTADLIVDPGALHQKYIPEASPYPTSGDTLVWQYEQSLKKCLTHLIEVGKASDFRPTAATDHADAVLPGMLFIMFTSVDTSFASKPTAKFKKPGG